MNTKKLEFPDISVDPPSVDVTPLPLESSPDVSTGILLSTLWSQSGVISIGNNTTVTYNEYTPIDPTTSKHSVTGCTNTAAAQIIYYFIEKDLLDLSLTLTADDAYTSVHEGISITVKADGSTPGTISFAAVNTYLGDYRLNSATHAAALLYACGVVQEANYSSDATSTSWSPELFYRAGFQGADMFYSYRPSTVYYWGTTDSRSNFTISDAGFEVLIENLQAGRPVGTSYPGHAVVIDGYDGAKDLFHINFGWGGSNSSTRWYSRQEMREQGYYEFVYDLFTERIETLTVNDGRFYGTGTMVRAFEQARGILGSNTVRFDAAVAGDAVELYEFVKVQDSTTIRDFNMVVTVTGARNFSWGTAFYGDSDSVTTFENFGGALIVDTGMDINCAMCFNYGKTLSVSTDHTLIYGGNHTVKGDHSAGAAAVLAALRTASDGGTAPDDFVLTSADYSFYGTPGDDTIAIAGNSLVVGDIELNSGSNAVSVTGGSRLYGDIISNGGSAAITIDSTSAVCGLVYASSELRFVLDSAAQEHALFTVERNVYNVYSNAAVTVDIADAEVGSYILFAADENASYADWLNRLALTVTGSGEADYTLVGNGASTSKFADVVYEDRQLKLDVKVAPASLLPKVLSVSADITALTSHDVTVSAIFNDNVLTAQYSTDGETWLTYTTGVVMEANGEVHFRGIDAAGRISKVASYTVANIDKEPPAAPTAEADLTAPTNRDVTVTAVFGDDCAKKQYSFDNSTWQTYTAAVVVSSNRKVYFRGIDAAGNVSDVTTYSVTNIDKTAPVITLTGDNVSAVHRTTLTAAVDDGSMLQYRIDGAAWRDYTGALTVEANAVYEFRATDAAGNTGSASITFANILSEVPEKLVGTPDGASWSPTGAARYVVEYSTDGFAHAIVVTTPDTGVDSFNLPSGTYSWRVRAEDDERWSRGADIVSRGADAAAKVVGSDADGIGDVFFATASNRWNPGFYAQHLGAVGGWEGTSESVVLAGKNRLRDFFAGSADANILLLTDDANGDALFVDDVYTALPEAVAEPQSRLARLDEIRAGAGDDVVDMTSQRFAYAGSGLTIRGGDGDDTIWATGGDNLLCGDAGDDRLVGGSGNDVLAGGSGNDRMHGGGGEDVFTFGTNWGRDTVEQLAGGTVTLWFASGSAANWNADTLTYADGTDSVTVSGVTAGQVTLKFGDDGSARYAGLTAQGAFAEHSSERIFEEHRGVLAAL